jgi:tyrosine-protein phosphatase SIW14
MNRYFRIVLVTIVVLLVGSAPLLYSSYRQNNLRNFRVEEAGVLYRSGQLTRPGLQRVFQENGIRTLISLRSSRVAGAPAPDAWEEEFCANQNPPVRHVRIVPRVWSPDEKGGIPAEDAVQEFLAVMDDPKNYPVLIHCFAGIHRTGTMCALYRMEYQHWTVEQAITEMHAFGFEFQDLHEHIGVYLRSYVPRWKRASSGK